jgi:hypothetical protein
VLLIRVLSLVVGIERKGKTMNGNVPIGLRALCSLALVLFILVFGLVSVSQAEDPNSRINFSATDLEFIPTGTPGHYAVQVEVECWRKGTSDPATPPSSFPGVSVELSINGSSIGVGEIDIVCCDGGELCASDSPPCTNDDCSPPGCTGIPGITGCACQFVHYYSPPEFEGIPIQNGDNVSVIIAPVIDQWEDDDDFYDEPYEIPYEPVPAMDHFGLLVLLLFMTALGGYLSMKYS